MTLLKKSKTSMPAIVAVALMALTIVGFSYAHWSDTLSLNGTVTTGKLCAEFEKGMESQKDPFGPFNDWTCGEGFVDIHQITKNIGYTSITYDTQNHDNCPNIFKVDMVNVYPCYYEHIGFWVKNCGTIPWVLTKVTFNPGSVVITTPEYVTLDLNGDGKADIEIKWGDNFGIQTDPGKDFEISFQIHVLEPIPQDSVLSFTAAIEVINWNEYPLPP